MDNLIVLYHNKKNNQPPNKIFYSLYYTITIGIVNFSINYYLNFSKNKLITPLIPFLTTGKTDIFAFFSLVIFSQKNKFIFILYILTKLTLACLYSLKPLTIFAIIPNILYR